MGIKPGFTVQQFLSPGYLEKKLWLLNVAAKEIYEKSGRKKKGITKRVPRISEEEEPELFHSLPKKTTLENSIPIDFQPQPKLLENPSEMYSQMNFSVNSQYNFNESNILQEDNDVEEDQDFFYNKLKKKAYVVKESLNNDLPNNMDQMSLQSNKENKKDVSNFPKEEPTKKKEGSTGNDEILKAIVQLNSVPHFSSFRALDKLFTNSLIFKAKSIPG